MKENGRQKSQLFSVKLGFFLQCTIYRLLSFSHPVFTCTLISTKMKWSKIRYVMHTFT